MSIMKINFIKTIIPETAFKKQYKLGSLMIYHIGEELNKELGAYECYECTVPIGEYDEVEIQKAFVEFSARMDALKLKQAKADKISEITSYDTSSSVNGFMLNGNAFWLDKATRVGLMNSTEITKAAGQETTDLWMGDVKLTIPCDTVIKLLSAIELYALECFNTTARHKAEVAELKTVEDVEKYDIKEGYPKQLEVNLQQ